MLGVGWGWCAKQMGDKLGCEGVCMVDGCEGGGGVLYDFQFQMMIYARKRKAMGEYGLMVE